LAGAAAESHDIEIPLALADCLGLSEGEVVRVAARPMAPSAVTVQVEPEAEEDWEAVMAAAGDVEQR
jgi:hypothetical protein